MVRGTVSVIIPTYNYGRFLAEATTSVLNQTVQAVEIIVVDDGSTDDTDAVVDSFGHRVRYIKQQNAGVSAARNRGVRESSGEYIAFLDADDTWEPTKLEKQLARFAEDERIGLVHCGIREFDDKTGAAIRLHLEGGEGDVAENLLIWDGPVIIGPGGTVMVRRKAFDAAGGFDTRMKVGEDWDFCYRVARKFRVGFVREPLVNYRSHSAAAHSNVDEMQAGMALFYKKAFADPSVAHVRRRAYGNFHRVMSGSYFRFGRIDQALAHAARSIWMRPANTGYFFRSLVRNLGHRESSSTSGLLQKTLYVCYFGVNQPLVQTQVIPYLLELAKDGYQISLLTFEPEPFGDGGDGRRTEDQVRNELAEKGIEWHWLVYHKSPSVPATIFDVFNGAYFIWNFCRRRRPDILHGRAHIATLPAFFARRLLRHKPKVIFDIRGFLPEEYTEGGMWKPDGWLYKAVKRVEARLLKDADGFVVLTEKAREILFPDAVESGVDRQGRPVEVIPCCVDIDRFASVDRDVRRSMRDKLELKSRKVFVYVGSFGSDWYLPRETADLLAEARRRDDSTFAMFLSQTSPDFIKPLLIERGFSDSDMLVRRVSPNEIPDYLSAADVAISFIKPCYSKLASSPTKNAEYLASGLPLICNSGVGDTGPFTSEDNVGWVIDEFNAESYAAALAAIDEMLTDREATSERCRQSARKRFDLATVGGERYRRLYRKILLKKAGVEISSTDC